MNKCNSCGCEVPDHEVAKFQYQYGYFSERDGDKLILILCPECTEMLTKKLIGACKINPIKEYSGNPDDPYGKCIEVKHETDVNQISWNEYIEAEWLDQCA